MEDVQVAFFRRERLHSVGGSQGVALKTQVFPR